MLLDKDHAVYLVGGSLPCPCCHGMLAVYVLARVDSTEYTIRA